MNPSSLLNQPLSREFTIERGVEDTTARTVALAFSSETPVNRGGYVEILDHSPENVDLSRMSQDAPLLWMHDARNHLGVIRECKIDADRKGRAIAKFGRGALASEKYEDVRDGILTRVSVGYACTRLLDESKGPDGIPVFRFAWSPHEVSLVSVAADNTVGVNRSQPKADTAEPAVPVSAPAANNGEQPHTITVKETRNMAEEIKIDTEAVKADTRKAELARISELTALGRTWGMDKEAGQAISEGATVEQFRAAVLDEVAKRQAEQKKAEPVVGMNPKEVAQYSITNAIRAVVDNNWSKAGLELEASKAADAAGGSSQRGSFRIPWDVLKSPQFRTHANVTTVGQGGYLVGTDQMAGSFIDALRANSVILPLCVTMPGLRDSVSIPKLTSGSTAYWVAEDGSLTESTLAFGQLAMSPKTLGAFASTTRKLILQSNPAIEQIIRDDITQTIALAIDKSVIEGAGTNEPTGVVKLGGNVNTVAFGGYPSWAKIVDMVTAVAADKVPLIRPAYIGSPEFVGKCLQTEKTSSNGQYLMTGYDSLNGFPFRMSTNITNTYLVFGSWNNCLVGFWGGLDVLVDPYTHATSGAIGIQAFQSMDLGFRYDKAFVYSTGLTVT